MRSLIFLFFLSFSLNSFGQKDSIIYYNRSWNVAPKADAIYYRVLNFDEEAGKYLIKDYYITGELQMEAFSAKTDCKYMEGIVKRYHKNGKFSSISVYSDVQRYKEQFFDINGNYLCSGEAFNGRYNDTFPGFLFCKGGFEVYREGGLKSAVLHYKNFAPALVTHYNFERDSITEYFYDRSGKELGKCIFQHQGHAPIDGKYAEFYPEADIVYFKNRDISIKSINYVENRKLVKTDYFDKEGASLGSLSYLNGSANDGLYINNNTYSIYKFGKKEGWEYDYFPNTKIVSRKVFFDNNMKEGDEIYYSNTGKKLSVGNYLLGKPVKGVFVSYGAISRYENGKKDGTNYTLNFMGDTTRIENYKDGILEGETISFNEDKSIIISGIYKNGKYFDGTFENKYGDHVMYKKGTLVKTTGKSESNLFTLDHLLGEKTQFNKKGEVIAHGFLVKELPFDGSFFIKRNEYKEYSKGLIIKEINYNGSIIISEFNYVNGIKDGTCKYYDQQGKLTSEGEYRNDLPFDGKFLINGKLQEFKNGQIEGVVINRKDYILESITYRNGIKEGPYSVLVTNLKQNAKSDSLKAEGIYRNNNPYSGVFLFYKSDYNYKVPNRISSYDRGLKDGTEVDLSYDLKDTLVVRNFKKNLVEGKVTYFSPGKKFESNFEAGKFVSGYRLVNNRDNESQYELIINGIKTGVTIHQIISLNI